jgi:hypothetical protein
MSERALERRKAARRLEKRRSAALEIQVCVCTRVRWSGARSIAFQSGANSDSY